MTTFNSLKGYGKVDPIENEIFRRKTRRRVAIVVVPAVILLLLAVGAVVGFVLSKNKDHGSPPPPTNTVQTLCALTNYPDSCYSSLSSANTSDPQALFKLSLKSAYDSLSQIKDLPTVLADGVDGTLSSSLNDCKDLIANAFETLNDTVFAIDGVDVTQLSPAKVDDLKTQLSSVITDRETCLDSLKEANDTLTTEKIRSATQNFAELTSNCLAMVSKGLGIVSGKNRKLLGYESGFPRWLREEDRRILPSANPMPIAARNHRRLFTEELRFT